MIAVDIGRVAKVGEYTTLYTNLYEETCEGTLIAEDTVFLTGVH